MWDAFDFFRLGGFTRGFTERKVQEICGKVLRDDEGDYTLDSCYTFDGGYETAIKKYDGNWIITESYETEEQMKEGHKKWIKFVKRNPKTAYDVHLEKRVKF